VNVRPHLGIKDLCKALNHRGVQKKKNKSGGTGFSTVRKRKGKETIQRKLYTEKAVAAKKGIRRENYKMHVH